MQRVCTGSLNSLLLGLICCENIRRMFAIFLFLAALQFMLSCHGLARGNRVLCVEKDNRQAVVYIKFSFF